MDQWIAVCSTPLLLLLLLLTLQTAISAPVVHAPWGALQGVNVEGEGGRQMVGYLGIPYAVPPVGERRFEKPLPHPGPGKGEVFVADREKPACPQDQPGLIGSAQAISEDCLFLNVYVPQISRGESPSPGPLPVMVFIHGGAFTMGSAASYRPSKFVADEQVIVVTIQYRLGALGFISSGDDALPGNLGLWDQNLALHWVKDNIWAFGGDAKAITIFGDSGGSYSAGLQMMSPQSRGLFQRVFMQSGSPGTLAGSLSVSDPKANFQLVADQFQCGGGTNVERVECLKKVPPEDYLNKTVQLIRQASMGGLFYPVVDGEFLPGDPVELIQDKDYVEQNGIGEVDVMMSFTDREGSLVLFILAAAQLPPQALASSQFFSALVDSCVKFNEGTPEPRFGNVSRKVVEFFYRGADAGSDQPVPPDTATDLYRDCILGTPSLQWMSYLAAAPHTATRYLLTLEHPFACNAQSGMPGSHHGDGLMLQFDSQQLLPPDSFKSAMFHKTRITAEEEPLSAMFVRIATSFAKTGDPNPAVPEVQAEGGWPQFQSQDEAYLALSLTPRVHHAAGPYRNPWALWHRLLPQLVTSLTSPVKAAGTDQLPQGKASEGEKDEL